MANGQLLKKAGSNPRLSGVSYFGLSRSPLTSRVPPEPEARVGPEAAGPLEAPARSPVVAQARKNMLQEALREPRRQALLHYGIICGEPLCWN